MADENPKSESEGQEFENIPELFDKAKADSLAIERIKSSIEAYPERFESYVQEIATLKQSIEEDSNNISDIREEFETTKTTVAENADAIQKHKNTTDQLLANIQAEIQKERDDAITLLETIKKHEANVKLISDIAEEKDAKVSEYEDQLKDLTSKYSLLNEQIEDLLPGATSAGLASAFETRKNSFQSPKKFWTFIQMVLPHDIGKTLFRL